MLNYGHAAAKSTILSGFGSERLRYVFRLSNYLVEPSSTFENIENLFILFQFLFDTLL